MKCYFCKKEVKINDRNTILDTNGHYITFVHCQNCDKKYLKESYLESKLFNIYEINKIIKDKCN